MKAKSVAAGMESREHEVDASDKAQPQPTTVPNVEEIRLRAYELYLERGCLDGSDVEDWLQAERKLVEKYQAR